MRVAALGLEKMSVDKRKTFPEESVGNANGQKGELERVEVASH